MTSKEAIEYLKGVGYQASAFSRFEPYYEDGTNYKEAVDVIEAELKKAEPVKRGKWVRKGEDIYCSVCNEESACNAWGASKFSKYCPNCGAKMDLD